MQGEKWMNNDAPLFRLPFFLPALTSFRRLMPPPFKVELLPHDPQWAAAAEEEGSRLMSALGAVLLEVHHIGSTAIPDIVAKAVLDLLPVVSTLEALDERRETIEALGYEWWGELGLPGRRFIRVYR